MTCLN